MRTTLTIDDDVARRLEQVRKKTGQTFKTLTNKALRAGLQAIDRGADHRPRKRFTMTTSSGGKSLIDIADVSEALAAAEGESHK